MLHVQEVSSLRDELTRLRRQAELDRRRAAEAEADRNKAASSAKEERQALEKVVQAAQVGLSRVMRIANRLWMVLMECRRREVADGDGSALPRLRRCHAAWAESWSDMEDDPVW